MNKLLTTMFALAVACVTVSAQAQKITGNAEDGAKKVAMCVGCHGIIGYQASFPEIHKVPMIAGQSANYIVSALTAYKGGDRKHPTMRAIADSLTEQDIADLAAYYSQLGVKEGDAPPATAAKAAERARAGPDLARQGQRLHQVPRRQLQHAERRHRPQARRPACRLPLRGAQVLQDRQEPAAVGRSNGVMSGQAKKFSNAELKELASYISSLPGELKTVPESRIHHAK